MRTLLLLVTAVAMGAGAQFVVLMLFGTQANPKAAFAEWMLRHGKGYANDAKVRMRCDPAQAGSARTTNPLCVRSFLPHRAG